MRRLSRSAIRIAILAGLWPLQAGAVEYRHDRPPVVPGHDCTCRYQGEDVRLGELRCIATPDGPRSAQCVMEQNVTSWHPVSDPCPEAALPQSLG